jgi:hypothetical protein
MRADAVKNSAVLLIIQDALAVNPMFPLNPLLLHLQYKEELMQALACSNPSTP